MKVDQAAELLAACGYSVRLTFAGPPIRLEVGEQRRQVPLDARGEVDLAAVASRSGYGSLNGRIHRVLAGLEAPAGASAQISRHGAIPVTGRPGAWEIVTKDGISFGVHEGETPEHAQLAATAAHTENLIAWCDQHVLVEFPAPSGNGWLKGELAGQALRFWIVEVDGLDYSVDPRSIRSATNPPRPRRRPSAAELALAANRSLELALAESNGAPSMEWLAARATEILIAAADAEGLRLGETVPVAKRAIQDAIDRGVVDAQRRASARADEAMIASAEALLET